MYGVELTADFKKARHKKSGIKNFHYAHTPSEIHQQFLPLCAFLSNKTVNTLCFFVVLTINAMLLFLKKNAKS